MATNKKRVESDVAVADEEQPGTVGTTEPVNKISINRVAFYKLIQAMVQGTLGQSHTSHAAISKLQELLDLPNYTAALEEWQKIKLLLAK